MFAGIEAAFAAGLKPVKINAVARRDVNEAGLRDLLRYALRLGHNIRRAGEAWNTPAGVTGEPAVVVPVRERGSGSHLVAALRDAEVLAVVPADKEEVRPRDLLFVIGL